MSTFLNNWNPDRNFKWQTNAADSAQTRRGIPVRMRWSASGTKAIGPGDRVFLGRQGSVSKDGTLQRGVIASGIAVSPFFVDTHWEDTTKTTTYNIIEFDTILTPEMVLRRDRLVDDPFAEFKWGVERGGVHIPDEAAAELEKRWADYLEEIGFGRYERRLNQTPYQPDPRKRKAVEDAAIQEAILHFRSLGYKIQNRQTENVGWDLEAVNDSEVLLLEVKGTSGSCIQAELTPNEYTHMQSHRDQYRVCIVVDALGPGRQLGVFKFDTKGHWRDEQGRILIVTPLTGARLSV